MNNVSQVNVAGISFRARCSELDFFRDKDAIIRGPIWELINRGEWEPQIFEWLLRLDRSKVFLDIGAWTGPITLTALALGFDVVSVEPDPAAYRALCDNLVLNDFSAKTLPIAIAKYAGISDLYYDHLGNSETSLLQTRTRGGLTKIMTKHILVPSLPLSSIVKLQPVGFSGLKIDIEGSEYLILDDLFEFFERNQVEFFLSLHPMNLSGFQSDDLLLRLNRFLASSNAKVATICEREPLTAPSDTAKNRACLTHIPNVLVGSYQ